jgi:hypothetical protein
MTGLERCGGSDSVQIYGATRRDRELASTILHLLNHMFSEPVNLKNELSKHI